MLLRADFLKRELRAMRLLQNWHHLEAELQQR